MHEYTEASDMTAKELALMAGVSRGTVDRVLHGRGGVKEDTRRHVLQVAREQGYMPTRAGGALSGRQSLRIAAIINGRGNPFFDDVTHGARDALSDYSDFNIDFVLHELKGYDILAQKRALDMLDSPRGLLITPINTPDIAKRINQMVAGGSTVVTVNSDIDGCDRLCYVGCDDTQSGRTAGRMLSLMTQGKANVLVVCGGFQMLGHQRRVNGFREVLPDTLRVAAMVENGDDDEISYARVKAALMNDSSIDAVYFAAAGTPGGIRAIRQAGTIAPERILASDATPDVTRLIRGGSVGATICQQPYLQGYQAMRTLLQHVLFAKSPEKSLLYTQSEVKLTYNL